MDVPGAFAPEDAAGGAPVEATLEAPVPHAAGEEVPVVLWPGADEVLRTGTAGILRAWLPFAGALVLAAPVIAAGLGMRRTAWVAGLSGAALLGAAFATL